MTKDSSAIPQSSPRHGAGFFAPIRYDKVFKIIAKDNSELMIDLLQCLIPGLHIASVVFEDKEEPGLDISDKSSNFDLRITTGTQEQCIVEVQCYHDNTYPDRMIAYSAAMIRRQLANKRRESRSLPLDERARLRMDYHLHPVYVISLMLHQLPHQGMECLEGGLVSRYSLRDDRSSEPLNDTLHFIFLEAGRLRLGPEDAGKCRTAAERLAWSLRYMHLVKERPASFDDPLSEKLYNQAAFANMGQDKQDKIFSEFDAELKWISEMVTAKDEGRAEGLAAGRQEVAQRLLDRKMPLADVAELTGLTLEQVRQLQ